MNTKVDDNHKDIPYIVIGEECPICYEPMLCAKNSYYTACGHKFHRTCITNVFNSSLTHNTLDKCPLCRQDMGWCYWVIDGGISYSKYDNSDFFMDYMPTKYCENPNHSAGSRRKTGCTWCISWAYSTDK